MPRRNGNLIVGRNIRMYRVGAGMTQEDLCNALGYKNKSSIGKIECANVDVRADQLSKIATVLGVRVSDLLKGTQMEDTSTNSYSKYVDWFEYLPYLSVADEPTIVAIRSLLGMQKRKANTIWVSKLKAN